MAKEYDLYIYPKPEVLNPDHFDAPGTYTRNYLDITEIPDPTNKDLIVKFGRIRFEPNDDIVNFRIPGDVIPGSKHIFKLGQETLGIKISRTMPEPSVRLDYVDDHRNLRSLYGLEDESYTNPPNGAECCGGIFFSSSEFQNNNFGKSNIAASAASVRRSGFNSKKSRKQSGKRSRKRSVKRSRKRSVKRSRKRSVKRSRKRSVKKSKYPVAKRKTNHRAISS